MAASADDATQQYLRISDINKEPLEIYMPIRGYEEMPVVPLEQAVESLVSILPEIKDYVHVAKQRCKPVPADGLTRDESASIILYSMEWKPHEQCLYFALNSALRAEDRQKLKPWFLYLKLVLTALARIPSSSRTVYRGVKLDLSEKYSEGSTFVWWGFSSCTSVIGVLKNEQFLGKIGERTMFTIECDTGKDISQHSYYRKEKEILLLAARQFIVESCLRPAPDLHMIQLKEIPSPICLLRPVTTDPSPNETSTDVQPKQESEATVASIQPKQQSEATSATVQQKTDYVKLGANYTTEESSTITKETAESTEQSEKEEFAKPDGTYEKLNCNGRLCAKCGKCRDWYYTGDNSSWQWIRNVKNWKKKDWDTYSRDGIEDRFKRRDGATCSRRLYSYGASHRFVIVCLCEDNTQNAF